MLKRFNRLLALAAVLFTGLGLWAAPPAADAPVPNRTAPPTVGGDQSAIVDRANRRRELANARAAAAARAQAALKAKGGKVSPLALGQNPANINNAAKFAKANQAYAAAKGAGGKTLGLAVLPNTGIQGPGFQLAQPDYMLGTASNWHNTKPITKFVDGLAGIGAANANNLGNYIPFATPTNDARYPGSDYYEIDVVQYYQQFHSNLNPTLLRGYQAASGLTAGAPAPAKTYGPTGAPTTIWTGAFTGPKADAGATLQSNYLGPIIIAKKDRAVRVKMTNKLPIGAAGDLFIPVDTTVMGTGIGHLGGTEVFSQNRAEFHLHGGLSPWISDGTPHQWVTPAGDPTSYKKGLVFKNVPDMIPAGVNDGDGIGTYFWSNQQSGRLMFYHDHTFGLTRLNVYAGEAAGYLIVDPVETKLINQGLIPSQGTALPISDDPWDAAPPAGVHSLMTGGSVYTYGIPLVIQDKTFVDTSMLGVVGELQIDPRNPTGPKTFPGTDPTWDVAKYGGDGSLWFPHVYMPNQNPADMSGANAMGRWDYAQWFWPPYPLAINNGGVGLQHGAEPAIDPATGLPDANGTEIPGTPNPSLVPEAFMDTPVVNGSAYPTLTVDPKAYRFRILNASNDRFWNLSFCLLYTSPSPRDS